MAYNLEELKLATHECPLCHQSAFLIWSRKNQPLNSLPAKSLEANNLTIDLNLYFCADCLHGHLFPIPDEEILKQYYAQDYGSNTSILDKNGLTGDLSQQSVDYVLAEIDKNFDRKISVVDIGGGDGFMLEQIKSRCSERLLIELDSYTGAIAKRFGIEVMAKHLDENLAQTLQHKFDLAISCHVIEHVPEPAKFMSNIFNMVKPDGKVIIEAPDVDKVLAKNLISVVMVEHLHYFSLRSLNKIVGNDVNVDSHDTVAVSALIATLSKTPDQRGNNIISNSAAQRIEKSAINFDENLKNDVAKISEIVGRWRKENKKIWIWGAGRAANEIFSIYGQSKDDFEGYIDSDDRKSEMSMTGAPDLPILLPESAKKLGVDAVLIASFSVDEITSDIQSRGWDIEVSDIYQSRLN
jgi:2-polyprenyl-3-methyl-5-hydroxy-6-metoxy-1,4-benzoquinol methylase